MKHVLILKFALFFFFGSAQNITLKPEYYGADGRDQNNDRAAFELMFNQLDSHFVVELSGIYFIDSVLKIQGKKNFRIIGNNAVIKVMDGTPKGSTIEGEGGIIRFVDCEEVTVEDLVLDANNQNRTIINNQIPAHNLRINGGKNIIIRNVKNISCIQDCFTIQKSYEVSENVRFENCRAENFFRSGMSVINGRDITITGGVFGNSRADAIGGGLNVEENTNEPYSKNITISNVHFYNNKGYGVQVTDKNNGSKNVIIEKCFFEGNELSAIKTTFKSLVVSDCVFENHVGGHSLSRAVIDVSGAGAVCEVKGNKFYNNAVQCIYTNSEVDRLTFEGNEIIHNLSNCISGRAAMNVILNNRVKNCDNSFYQALDNSNSSHLIEGNRIDSMLSQSIYLGAGECIVKGNIIAASNLGATSSFGAIRSTGAVSPIIIENIVYGNGGNKYAFRFEGSVKKFSNNTMIDFPPAYEINLNGQSTLVGVVGCNTN